MIRWFLNLFPAYQRLVAESAAKDAEIARLTAEASAAEARASEADKRVDDIKRVADAEHYARTGRYIFSKAEAPVAAPVEMPARRTMLASRLAQQLTRQAQEQRAGSLRQQFEKLQQEPSTAETA